MSWATKLPKPAFFGIPLDPDKDGHMPLVQPLKIEHHRHATRFFRHFRISKVHSLFHVNHDEMQYHVIMMQNSQICRDLSRDATGPIIQTKTRDKP